MPYTDLLNRIQALDFNEVFRRTFKRQDVKDFIIDLNTRKQLFDQNVNSEGVKLEDIGGSLSPSTQERKKRRGLPTDPAVFDTGDYYKTFRVRIRESFFFVESDPSRLIETFQRYGGETLEGLTNESIEALIDFIVPIIQQEVFRAVT